jgi:hypothetical protein
MQLEFSGTPRITASRSAVWKRLLDPQILAECTPGAEAVEPIDATHFRMTCGLGIGVLRLRFHLDVELADIVEPESASLHAHGKATGSAVDLQTAIRLEETGPRETQLRWQARVTVHGALAGIGSFFLEAAARRLTSEFWSQFAAAASAAGG